MQRRDGGPHLFRVTAAPAIAMLFAWSVAPLAAAECRAPSYRKGHVWEDTPASIMMNISIRMGDFAPERLLCLAGELRRHYSGRRQVFVFIFSSYAAAKYRISPSVGDTVGPGVDWAVQEHAQYVFDADKHEEAVIVAPLGGLNTTFNTRIDLPAVTIPPCTLQLSGRCMVALDYVRYPSDVLKAGIAGAVTIEGTVDRDGVVKRARAVDLKGSVSEMEQILINATLQNVRSWRFASADNQTLLHVTYSYVIDGVRNPSGACVQFELPDRVVIRHSPPR